MTKKTGLANAVKKPIDPEEWVKSEPSKPANEEKLTKLVAEVPADLHRRFKVKCVSDGTKIRSVIQFLLEQYVEGKLKPT